MVDFYAIRWDVGGYGTTSSDEAENNTLRQPEFHDRAPFYAVETNDGVTTVPGGNSLRIVATQATFDQEIGFALSASLRGWAFLRYINITPGLAEGAVTFYKNSTVRAGLKFTSMEQIGSLGTMADYQSKIPRLITEMGQSYYGKVTISAVSRPLMFFYYEPSDLIRLGDNIANLTTQITEVRTQAAAASLTDPYIVVLYYDATVATSVMTTIGANAISSYVPQRAYTYPGQYQDLRTAALAHWAGELGTGSKMIPTAITGWSPDPRYQRPVFWQVGTQKSYLGSRKSFAFPTDVSLAAHISESKAFVVANPSACAAQVVLIYAWNEFGEGGRVLCPSRANPAGSWLSAVSAAIQGSVPAPSFFLTTSGRQMLDYTGARHRTNGVAWYGANTDAYVPHGLWAVNWQAALNSIKGMGFNTLRLPFSGAFTADLNRPVPAFKIDYTKNPDLVGKTCHQIFSMIIDYAAGLGLRVIIEMHQRTPSNTPPDYGLDGDPIWDGNAQNSIDAWLIMANQYGSKQNIVGFEPYNEPHALTWPVWAAYVENCAAQVHAVCPQWLVLVQGTYYGMTAVPPTPNMWWGGNFTGWATRPIVLTNPNRLVACPHEYGQTPDVSPPQDWLKTTVPNYTPADWPNNLRTKFEQSSGYLFRTLNVPMVIGEWGGNFGFDKNGSFNPTLYPNYADERVWRDTIIRDYADGKFDADGISHLAPGEVGMGRMYWCWNSVDTDASQYSLTTIDWVDNTLKLENLAPIFGYVPTPPVPQPFPPGSWSVTLPTGLIATYLQQVRDGTTGTLVTITGTATAGGTLIYFRLKDLAAVATNVVTFTARVQVDATPAAVTNIYSAVSEYSAAYAYQAGSGTDFYATRTTLASRAHMRPLTSGLTTIALGEVYTNAIANGAAVSLTLWIGSPQISKTP